MGRCAGLCRRFLLLAGFAAVATGASGPGEEMLEEYNRLLNILIYTAAALATFSLMWAGFTYMWDHENPSSTSSAKAAAIGALSGLVLTLLAKAITVLMVDSTTIVLPTR
jgi:hypothetical protein